MKNFFPVFLFLSILLAQTSFVAAIPSHTIDSLEKVLKSNSLTTEKRIETLNELSWEYVDSEPVKAQGIAKEALDLALTTKNSQLKAIAYHRLGTALYNRQQLDSARLIFEMAIPYTSDGKGGKLLAGIYQELGNIEADMGNYEPALARYHLALKIFEKEKDEPEIAQTLSNIGAVYTNLGNYDKMFEYTSKALAMHRRTGSKRGIAVNLTNIADYYFIKRDSANTIKALIEARMLFHELKASIYEANTLGSIGDYYSDFLGQEDKAIEYYEQSLLLLKSGDNNNLWMDGFRKISLAYYHKEDYKNALEFMKKAIVVTDAGNMDYVRMNYNMLAYIYIGLRDAVKATEALDKYMELTDKVNFANQQKRIAEMEVNYQTEKKKQQILVLEKEKKLNKAYLVGLLVLLSSVVVITILIYRAARNKSIIASQEAKIQSQKISELEKEKQLIATKSVLQGEEAERSRMARDLHDGLGGMLSSVKINLSTMKGNSIITDENAEAFSHAIKLLDHSITELRRVAHNMMPETLVHYGLKAAFEDFVSRIRTDKTPDIEFQFFGEEVRYSSELEITVYRIGQELVNNSLKHSRAASINLQLISEANRLCVQVIDNGKGFDTTKTTGGGKGIESIRDRVTAMNGKFEIESNPEEGTEATVEFLVL
jgi:two-component system NarL family sensor kinase